MQPMYSIYNTLQYTSYCICFVMSCLSKSFSLIDCLRKLLWLSGDLSFSDHISLTICPGCCCIFPGVLCVLSKAKVQTPRKAVASSCRGRMRQSCKTCTPVDEICHHFFIGKSHVFIGQLPYFHRKKRVYTC